MSRIKDHVVALRVMFGIMSIGGALLALSALLFSLKVSGTCVKLLFCSTLAFVCRVPRHTSECVNQGCEWNVFHGTDRDCNLLHLRMHGKPNI